MKKTVCALGFFDGVHRAHSFILSSCARCARERSLKSMAVTFEKSPAEVFGREVTYLTPFEEKKRLILSLGIDEVIKLPSTKEFLSLSPESFVKDVLIDRLSAAVLLCGFNFSFGKNASGTAEDLKRLCGKYGAEVIIFDKMDEGGVTVSSSEIRLALANGDVKKANALLGRRFSLSGVVKKGKRLGTSLGFPTANIYPDKSFPEMKRGVYATRVKIFDKIYPSVTNVGINPTVGDGNLRVETYIKDFDADLYGKTITVEFLDFVRGEMKFASVEELRAQVEHDKESIQA